MSLFQQAEPPHTSPADILPQEPEQHVNHPQPPYYAVIFTSTRITYPHASVSSTDASTDSSSATAYAATAAEMFTLAAQQDGYLGYWSTSKQETVEEKVCQGAVTATKTISTTISYWRDQASIAAWRADWRHAEARRRGKAEWYASWRVRVCLVEREYGSGDEWL